MSFVGVFIFIGLLFIVAVGMIVWLATIILKNKETKIDNPLIIDFANYLEGSGRAVEEELDSQKYDGKIISKVKPKDVDPRKIIKEVEEYNIVTEQNKLISIPKGSWSKDLTMKIRLPHNPEHLPQEFKNTPFGTIMTKLTESKNNENLIINLIREGSKRKTELLHKMPDGELSESIIDLYEGIFKQMVEVLKKDKTSTFENPKSNSGGM